MLSVNRGAEIVLPIRCESGGSGVTGLVGGTGAESGKINLKIARADDADWTALAVTTHFTVNELSEGDYTIDILPLTNTQNGLYRIKVNDANSESTFDTEQYVVNVENPLKLGKSFLDEAASNIYGRGSYDAPFPAITNAVTDLGPGDVLEVIKNPITDASSPVIDFLIMGRNMHWVADPATDVPIVWLDGQGGIEDMFLESGGSNTDKVIGIQDIDNSEAGVRLRQLILRSNDPANEAAIWLAGNVYNSIFNELFVMGKIGKDSGTSLFGLCQFEDCHFSDGIKGTDVQWAKCHLKNVFFGSAMVIAASSDNTNFENVVIEGNLTIPATANGMLFNRLTVYGDITIANGAVGAIDGVYCTGTITNSAPTTFDVREQGDGANLDAIYAKLPSKNYLSGTANSDGDIELNEATGALQSIATDAVDAAALAADAVSEIQSGLATAANLQTVDDNVDAILVDTNEMQGKLPTGNIADQTTSDAIETDTQDIQTKIGTPANIDAGGATIADNLKKLADDAGGTTFDATTDSQEAIRDRGDAAWTSGAGLTSQQVRDAMKLAPTGGAPAAGSVDQHLDDIEADTTSIESKVDTVDANVDTIKDTDLPAVKADTAAIKVDTESIEPKVDTIDTNLDTVKDTDLPAVKSDTAAILVDTNEMQGKLPTGNIADQTTSDAIEADTQDIQTKIGTPTDTDLATDIANVQTDVTAILAAVDGLDAEIINDIKSVLTNGKPGAIVRFVDKVTGNDGNTGKTWAQAYATIAAATADMSATDGGYIFVKASYYLEDVSIPNYTTMVGVVQNADDGFAELRGAGASSVAPTLTLGIQATAINLRVGHRAGGSYQTSVVKMGYYSRFLNGTTGGIESDGVIQVFEGAVAGGAWHAEIRNSIISGSGNCDHITNGYWDDSIFINNRYEGCNKDYFAFQDADGDGFDIRQNFFTGVQTGYFYVKTNRSNLRLEQNIYDLSEGGGFYSAGSGAVCVEQNNAQWCNKSDTKGGDAIYDKIVLAQVDLDTLTADTTFLKKVSTNKQEFKFVDPDWYWVLYDDDGETELIMCKVEKYGGGAIDTLVGTGQPSIRNANLV